MENLKLYQVRYTIGDFFRGGRYLLGATAKDTCDFMSAWEDGFTDIKAEEVTVVQGMDGQMPGDYLIKVVMEKEVMEEELEDVPRDMYNEKIEAEKKYVPPADGKLRFYRSVYLNPNQIPCHEYLVGRDARQIYNHIKTDEGGKELRGEASDINVEEVRTEIGVIGREYGFFVFDVEVVKRLEPGDEEPEGEVYPVL
ncbi:MAG: hypothetical protein ACOX4U_04605 [Anaerovoracaceae bacterium]|jgi:hypothetical protein